MRLLAAALVVLLSANTFAGAQGPDKQEPDNALVWPQYRGNAGFTGVSADASVKPPLKLLWSYRLDGDASSDAGAGVTVAGGKVFVNVHNTRSILALNAHTGRFEWEYNATSVGYRTVPAYSAGRLFLWQRGQAKSYAILALDAANGKVLWRQPTGAADSDYHRVGLPIADGKVFCSEGGVAPAVAAYDEKTGQEVWRTNLGKEDGTCVLCPSVAGGRVFVGTTTTFGFRAAQEGAVIALDIKTGKEQWRRKNIFPNRTLVTDGRVVVLTMFAKEDLKAYVLDAKTGDTLWTGPKRFHYNPATITNDLVLIRPYGAACFAHDRETGKERWSFQVPGVTSGCCAPAVSGDIAYYGTGVISPGDLESIGAFQHVKAPREKGITGAMHAVDLKTGKSVWHFATANCICGDPALAYGRLYFTSRDGCVYCFAPAKAGEPTTPEAKDQSPAAPASTVETLLAAKFKDQPRPGKDWSMQGGDPHRAGLPADTPPLPLELAWKVDTGGRMTGAAAIRAGHAYIGSDGGAILAVDLNTGKKAWEFPTGAAIRCSPAAAGNMVYCGSDNGRFYALDGQTGKERWSFACGGPVQASPALVGGIVLFGANDHHVYALDRFTGKKLWSFRVNDYCLRAPPVVHGDQVFVGQWTDWVWSLDLKTGKLLWRTFIPVTVEALSYYRDKLYVRNPNYVIEVDPKTGKRLRLGSASWGWGGLAFMKNQLFLSGIQSQYGTNGATATDLDEEGAELKKPIPTLDDVRLLRPKGLKGTPDLAGMATPLVLGDKLCFAGAKGEVILTETDGTRRWAYKLGGTCHASPVMADDVLVVGCDDGHLYAFRGARPK